MRQDLLGALETYVRARVGTVELGRCVACQCDLGGAEQFEVGWIGENGGDAVPVLRACSLACLAAMLPPTDVAPSGPPPWPWTDAGPA
jgi:hypothetical protein